MGYKAPQCVLQGANNVLRFTAPNNTMWITSLHFYMAPNPPAQPLYNVIEMNGARSRAWVTDITVQGRGGLVGGVEATATRLYIEGASLRVLCCDMLVSCSSRVPRPAKWHTAAWQSRPQYSAIWRHDVQAAIFLA